MNLVELYISIKNPLNDDEIIKKLIEAYSKSSEGFGGFYTKLTSLEEKEYKKGEHYKEDSDKFYSLLFNKWKNSIVNISRERFIGLYNNRSYDKDFVKMREYLKTVEDVKTEKEANSIFFGNYQDKELEQAIDKYKWNSKGQYSGWVHVSSRDLTAKKDKNINVEHRLYINSEAIDTYKVVTEFINKCDENDLPYYFKFNPYADKDDTIVIYSDTESLGNYINILREMKKENEELISKIKNPPILTGKIDNWIGYGSEPKEDINGKKSSFNLKRSELIEKCISKIIRNWIYENKDKIIKYNGQNISFKDYFSLKVTENFINKLKKSLNYKPKNKSLEDYEKEKGYKLSDLENEHIKKNIYNIVKKYIDSNLNKIKNNEEIKPLELVFRDNKKINLTNYNIQTTIEQLSILIAKNDLNVINKVRNEIELNLDNYDIDNRRFCFDNDKKMKMFNNNIISVENESITKKIH